MAAGGTEGFRSGDAMFAFDHDLRVLSWNRAAEELTGYPADEALGRFCWELLGAVDERGALVCHAGCSYARLAREGWPVPGRELVIRTRGGRRRVALSTIAVNRGDVPVFLHLLRDGVEIPSTEPPPAPEIGPRPALTPRQREVLGLLGEGVPAKVIASHLGLSETTVRNHIRGILLELGCHSQLGAVAKARRWRLI